MPKGTYEHLKDGDGFSAPMSDIDLFASGNTRTRRKSKDWDDFCASIVRTKGVTQGVTVRLNPNDASRLELIAGYGRFQANELGGFEHIPAVFKDVGDKEAMAIMLAENNDREDLHIADEIRAAQDYVSLYDGDYKAAADDMGWPVDKLRRRIVLNKCTPNVLDALRDDKIALGHAEILSSFTAKMQDGTLQKITAERWTIDYLKERAYVATRPLASALFKTTDCNGCPHNSAVQASLFENTLGKDKCNNLVCFGKKTEQRLEELKTELGEAHEKVFISVEKPAAQRNTVSIEIVGEAQFTSGCSGCVDNAVILQDGINEDAGRVIENQCVKLSCFRKMVAAHAKQQADEQEAPAAKGGEGSKPAAATAKKKVAKKAAAQTTPVAVTALNRSALHKLSFETFKDDSRFREALFVANMAIKLGSSALKAIEDTWKPSLDLKVAVMDLYKMPEKSLEKIKQSLFELFITHEGTPAINVCDLMIDALSDNESACDRAIESWKPTESLLNSYLLGGLVAIGKKSGYQRHYDKIHGKGSFGKVAKRKSDLVKALLSEEFDWSLYAPDDYRKLINNKQPGKKS